MPFLEIRLLGPPSVNWTGKPLHIPRRQARGLLFRLAIHMQPVPREHLCYLFWSDKPENQARRNLSHLLTHLRRALPAPDDILSVDDQIALNGSLVWSDSVAFEQLCTAYQRRPSAPTLHEAVEYYRGPLLMGFSLPRSPDFESWMTLERQIWERHYLETLSLMIEEAMQAGNVVDAIELAQRYLYINRLDEEMHCRLMELYAISGNRGASLAQYRECVNILDEELGILPLSETTALYSAIVKGTFPGRQESERSRWLKLVQE